MNVEWRTGGYWAGRPVESTWLGKRLLRLICRALFAGCQGRKRQVHMAADRCAQEVEEMMGA